MRSAWSSNIRVRYFSFVMIVATVPQHPPKVKYSLSQLLLKNFSLPLACEWKCHTNGIINGITSKIVITWISFQCSVSFHMTLKEKSCVISELQIFISKVHLWQSDVLNLREKLLHNYWRFFYCLQSELFATNSMLRHEQCDCCLNRF